MPAQLQLADWPAVTNDLNAQGWSVMRSLLSPSECESVAALYDQPQGFRKRIQMARHGFGQGEYQYFAYPLPPLIAQLRASFYQYLAPLARAWSKPDASDEALPPTHQQYLERCHQAGQSRPTPLLLRYREGDYNCLHQDLYGELSFPFQVVVLLSRPGSDFTGGELVMTEQRPRMQSRPMVLPLAQGDAAIIAVSQRPVRGTRGVYRVNLRHGVSRINDGERHTLGIILHDAT